MGYADLKNESIQSETVNTNYVDLPASIAAYSSCAVFVWGIKIPLKSLKRSFDETIHLSG